MVTLADINLANARRFPSKNFQAKDDEPAPMRGGVHADLRAAGLKDITDHRWGGGLHETDYAGSHRPEAVHDILEKHGYRMNTHYRQGGGAMPPYQSYEHTKTPYGGNNVSLHHKEGKVTHVHFDYRRSND